MTIADLRVLVDNLEEYIHIPGGIERLKKTVLHLAVSGQLVPQIVGEGTGEELYREIQAEHPSKKKLEKPTGVEVPFDVPSGWRWTRFGNLGQFGSGSTPARGETRYYDGGINWFKSGELTDGYMTKDSEETISEIALKECSLRMNHKGDILVAMYGATAGKLGLLEVDGATNQAVCGVTVYNSVNRWFAYYWLLATRDDLIAQSSGAAQPNISKIKIVNHYFALPSVAEQRRIVEKIEATFALIDELDDAYKAEEAERSTFVRSSLRALSHDGSHLALDNLASVIKTKADASELRKAILHLAVSGKLVPQIASEGTGEELYGQIQVKHSAKKKLPEIAEDEPPFEIPKSWKWTRLGTLGTTQTGATPPKASTNYFGNFQPFIKPGDIYTDKVDYENEGLSEDGAKYLGRTTPAGSLLMVCIGTIGKSNLISCDCSYNQQINAISPVGLSPKYLLNSTRADYFQKMAWSKSSSTTISILNKGRWEQLLVPLPPLAEQERIVAKTAKLLNLVSELEKHLRE